MPYTWSYAPVTIHLETHDYHILSHHQELNTAAISGIYLFNNKTKGYFILAISDVPKPENYSYRFTNKSFITTSRINWFILDLIDLRYFNQQSGSDSPLKGFLKGLTERDQFKFSPHSHQNLCVLSLRLKDHLPQNQLLFDPKSLKPLEFVDSSFVDIPTKICVQCCPFSLTNAAIFSSYKIFGAVNYKVGKAGYLSDIRYLDDIIGGVVNEQESKGVDRSLGLVAGDLSKVNGDGSLMLIISWNEVFNLLNYKDLTISSDLRNASLFQTIESNSTLEKRSYDPIESVVRISVSSQEGGFWGSGIILSEQIIITNLHVLKLEVLTGISISVPGKPHIRITRDDLDIIASPLVGFDLCFLRLKVPNLEIVPVSPCNTYLDPLVIGQPVKSIGHGLIFTENIKEMKPFHSEGHLSTIVILDIDNSGNYVQSLLLSSASCWNGSSGGGLFNEKNELIGIMTSNGRLSNGEILPNFTLAIPINIIEKATFMILNNIAPVDVDNKISDVWSLKNTHTNVHINASYLTTHKL